VRCDLTKLASEATLVDALRAGAAAALDEVDHVFWVAGVPLRKQIQDYKVEDVRRLIDTHLFGPTCAFVGLHAYLAPRGRPYHVVTIASTSSWRVRTSETLYCALVAGKAHFARTFAAELARDLPGSRATLVHPGGMRTPHFWQGVDQALDNYMDPDLVAGTIWSEVAAQSEVFEEFAVLRNEDGSSSVVRGAQLPESISSPSFKNRKWV
jgi:NAD(P)-dependent dehydrogenase (short-subunit alcohol dehydrogenase family)